jgi:hypothetical protein
MGVAWLLDGSWTPHGQPLNLYEKTGTRAGDAIVLRFWARSPDAITICFGVGSDKDSIGTPAETGWLTLTPEWREYQIDLGRKDLSAVVCAFFWKVERGRLPPGGSGQNGKKLSFFVDDVRIVKVERPK